MNWQSRRLRTRTQGLLAFGPCQAAQFAHDTTLDKIAADAPSELGNYLTTVTKHFDTSPKELVTTFLGALSGELAYWYQNPWPVYLDKDRISDIEDYCRKELPNQTTPRRQNRINSLPSILKLHALPYVPPDIAAQYRQNIHDSYQRALAASAGRPPSGGLDIPFQAATAALVRDEVTWLAVEFDEIFLEDAATLCGEFLAGTLRFFHAAIAAWQFLLTYRNALRDRPSSEQHRAAEHIVSALESSADARRSYWFSELSAIFDERRGFYGALPEMLQLFLGHNRLDLFPRRVLDYIIRVRLESGYMSERLSESSMFRSPDFAERTRILFKEFSFDPLDFQRAVSAHHATDPRFGLTAEAEGFWRSASDRNDESVVHLEAERAQRASAIITRWLPFRANSPEKIVGDFLAAGLSIDEIVPQLKRGNVLGSLLKLSFSAASDITRRIQKEGGFRLLPLTPSDLDAALERIPPERLAWYREDCKRQAALLEEESRGAASSSTPSKTSFLEIPCREFSGFGDEVRSQSEPHDPKPEVTDMAQVPEEEAKSSIMRIPPGTYRPGELPPPSDEARRILAKIDRIAGPFVAVPDQQPTGRGGLRPTDGSPAISLRATDKSAPLSMRRRRKP
ncbi:MAG: hypothetical protein U1E21_18410 [Reyranellaceae bacterium]